jgi:tetratricopeptide (TPR) repeat protein
MASPDARKHLAHSGASAAIGLFTGPSADSTAIVEYRALTGEGLGREVRALLALSQGDSTGARRLLTERDTTPVEMSKWTYGLYNRPLAAQAYFLLGDYNRTLSMLRDFEPQALKTAGFDSRWGMMGRVRLLRAAAYEQLGRRAEARQEYQQVLAQWKAADAALKPFIQQAEKGLARLGEV